MTAKSRLRLQVWPSDDVTLILFPAGLALGVAVGMAEDTGSVEDMGRLVDGGLLEGFATEEGGVLEVGVVLVGVTGDLDPEYFLLF